MNIMEKEKKTDLSAFESEIKEINRHIRDGINQWADVVLTADADEWAHKLDYFPLDIVNACLIFQHVCSNVGIKAGLIDEQKAEEFGQRFRQLVIDMTGYDPAEILANMKPHNGDSPSCEK